MTDIDIKELARKAGFTRIRENQYNDVTEEQLKKLLELYFNEIVKKLAKY